MSEKFIWHANLPNPMPIQTDLLVAERPRTEGSAESLGERTLETAAEPEPLIPVGQITERAIADFGSCVDYCIHQCKLELEEAQVVAVYVRGFEMNIDDHLRRIVSRDTFVFGGRNLDDLKEEVKECLQAIPEIGQNMDQIAESLIGWRREWTESGLMQLCYDYSNRFAVYDGISSLGGVKK